MSKLTDKQKTEIMLKYLIQRTQYGNGERSNVIFPELRLGSGYCGVAQRRIDLFVISSNQGNHTIAYEIKASRGDFKHDIEDDQKQRGARLYANEFYYVAPKGMIKINEVPLWAGLMEFDFEQYEKVEREQDKKWLFSKPVSAPLQPKYPPSWGLICAMVRHLHRDINTDMIKELEEKIKHLEYELDDCRGLLSRIANTDYDPKLLDLALMKYRKYN